MTEAVIRDAVTGGKPGLTGHEIVAAIGKRYWPGVKGQQILPAIYYDFAKIQGRLVKIQGVDFQAAEIGKAPFLALFQ